mmetsp:Transcript_4107/g.8022  ORF Transcript_4107/g.8022 Transcript_4107/m.8022 type:complete len:105 (-) Transcript_4107:2207-2521(-)
MAPQRRGKVPSLPATNVSKVIKAALPPETSVSREAKDEVAAAASVFIHFITSGALDYCHARKKSTITPEDVLEAIRESELNEFFEPLQQYLADIKEEAAKKPKK